MKIGFTYGIFGILAGLLLILLSLYLDIPSAPMNAGIEASRGVPHIAVKLLEATGAILFGVGLLNIMLETKDWRDYFEQRIRDLIVDQKYLNILDKETLNSLQTNILKAQFKDEQIDREGSFLNYFHSNLHKYIAEPYREDVTLEVICKMDENADFLIFDRITYVCRRSSTGIQSHIVWLVDEEEYSCIETLQIDIQYPYDHERKGEQERMYDDVPELGKELSIPLSDFKDVDGLIVIISSRYKANREKFQYWTMAHPSRSFQITIMFPPEMDLQVKPLVLNPELILTTVNQGYYKAKYDSWMLPESGLAWRFINKS